MSAGARRGMNHIFTKGVTGMEKSECAVIFPDYVSAITDALYSAGYEAYAVGGCVRDSLLGCEPHDWDIASSATPSETLRVLSSQGIDVRAGAGMKHGTVTAVVRNERSVFACEVTSFRRDMGYTDMRRPDSVEFGASLEEDLSRRDFTVNAIACGRRAGHADSGRVPDERISDGRVSDGRVSDGLALTDPFGGKRDLERKILRCVGEPRLRFTEDPLRILRGIRFASKLGFEIEEESARAMRELCATVGAVSRERVCAELLGILEGDFAPRVLSEYSDVISGALNITLFPERCVHFSESRSTGVRFVLYFGKEAPAAARSLKMSSDFIRRVECIASADELTFPLPRHRLKYLMRTFPKYYREMLEYAGIIQGQRKEYAESLAAADEILSGGECYSLAGLAVNGKDLADAGFSGKALGRELDRLLGLVCSGALSNDRETLLDASLKSLAKEKTDVLE